jgi:hypothetical protein
MALIILCVNACHSELKIENQFSACKDENNISAALTNVKVENLSPKCVHKHYFLSLPFM